MGSVRLWWVGSMIPEMSPGRSLSPMASTYQIGSLSPTDRTSTIIS